MKDIERGEREMALDAAVRRQGGRARKNTYAQMKNTMRGTEMLFRTHAKAKQEGFFEDAKERVNDKTKRFLEKFSANDLPSSSYIK